MIITRAEAKEKGLSQYFSGSTCPRGSVSVRRTRDGRCLCQKCSALKNEQNRILMNERYANDAAYRETTKSNSSKTYKENTKECKKRQLKYREANREKLREHSRSYRLANPERMRILHREWSRNNKENVAIRRILYRTIQQIGAKKEGRTKDILGYSPADIKLHMERQFTKGMSWGNYGEWHIDHIVSIKELIAGGETDPKVINCLSNLMPIWAAENHKKNSSSVYLI